MSRTRRRRSSGCRSPPGSSSILPIGRVHLLLAREDSPFFSAGAFEATVGIVETTDGLDEIEHPLNDYDEVRR